MSMIELRPNRDLLDENFDGYKLSLDPVPIYSCDLPAGIDHLLPSDDQFSFLHVKIFGLHNHLCADPWAVDDIYFIDNKWNVQKNVNSVNSARLDGVTQVWEVPSHRERRPGHYNTSMSFASPELAVVCDGAGALHLVATGSRAENATWKALFSDEVCGKERSFVVVNSRLHSVGKQRHVHCLLQHVDATATAATSPGGGDDAAPLFKTILEWITLAEGENNWSISSVRKLSGNGGLDYAALEIGCESVYVASDKRFHFIIDSEHSVEMINPMEPASPRSTFSWQQTSREITVWVPLPEVEGGDIDEDKVAVSIEEGSLRVALDGRVVLEGATWQRLDPAGGAWSLDKTCTNLELKLVKAEASVHWEELVRGDVDGEEIKADPAIAQAHQQLAHLTSEEVAGGEGEAGAGEESAGPPTFNPEQLEECDALPDLSLLARLDTHSHAITHQVNLGGHQWLFNVQLAPDQAPAICLRHDVDGCVWQMAPPVGDASDWPCAHVGTFMAFGYVQASKTQKKFLVCPPDMSYVAICESSRHIYLYRQPEVVNGKLRNRTTGQQVSEVAKQQLVNLDLATDVLGVHASNAKVYVLTADKLYAAQIDNN